MCGSSAQSPMDLNLRLTEEDCLSPPAGAAGALANRSRHQAVAGHPAVSVSKYMRSAVVSGSFGSLLLRNSRGRDVEYEATQVHLMAGSLHTINGSFFDAEMLVVHSASGSDRGRPGHVIISVLFRESSDRSSIFSEMGLDSQEQARELARSWDAPGTIHLDTFLAGPLRGASYSYQGSVPVPPCTEDVQYIVLAEPQPVGAAQLAKLSAVLLAYAGGSLKRPPIARMAGGGQCRQIASNSVQLPEAQVVCPASFERVASCWQQACDKSPVDIKANEVDNSAPPLDVVQLMGYTPTNSATVAPSPFSVDASGDFGHLMVNGRLFQARKLSIRAISQHTFDGRRYAGELVVEHWLFGDDLSASLGAQGHNRRLEEENSAGGGPGRSESPHRVMLSVPLMLGRDNALLRALGLGVAAHSRIISDGGTYAVVSSIDLAAALRPSLSRAWYWYSGGPIAPGACPAWGVKWMVFEQPLEVSLEQLNSLRLRISGFDSTAMTRPIRSRSITKLSIPKDGLEAGGCNGRSRDFNNQPSCWKVLSPICGVGRAQSPINIETSAVTEIGSQNFLAKISWKPIAGLQLTNTGDHLGVDSDEMGYATVIGPNGFPKYYQIVSIALRMPSEHLIHGRQFPAELQVTHKNQNSVLYLDNDDVLVTSIMFEIGEENKLLNLFLPEPLPARGESVRIQKPVDLMWALGPALEGPFFMYNGSFTRPSCAEVAQWVIFEKPMTLSLAQWQAFKVAFPNPGNNRPVQALNGRGILKNSVGEARLASFSFFLNRQDGRNALQRSPLLILFPVAGTLLLCGVAAIALFQHEDSARKEQSAGGLTKEKPTTIGKGSYDRL